MTGVFSLADYGLSAAEMQAELERFKSQRRARDFASAAPSFDIDAAAHPRGTRPAASPFTGEPLDAAASTAVSDGARQVDDEARRKRRRPGGGGGAAAAVRSKPVAPIAKARPAVVVKSALAAGSHAAVVKLASFGSGRARAHALMSYQTDKGELAAERHDGIILKGAEDISALAAEWGAQSSGREPSKDSLGFTAAFDAPLTNETVRESLHEALRGHAFAWRAETRDGQTHVHVVTLAAGSLRDENGKAERFYPNKKSNEGLRDRIETAFDRDAKIDVQGWAHGVEGATRQLARLNRAGELDAETSGKHDLKEEAVRLYERRGGKLPTDDDFNPNLEIAQSWRRQMRSNEPRDFAHVIFSAKPGTDKDAFLDASRATLAKEFEGHEYIFVMHTNRQHIHVHAAIRMENDRGERLHPTISDFRRWRETLAEEARERQIPIEATSRFDEANVPAYKLKDIRMVEKGIAPESVRRRVEAASQQFGGGSPPADLLRLKDRAEQATIPFLETRAPREGSQTRTAETMTWALADMRKRLDNMSAIVDPDKRQAFEKYRADMLDAAERAIDAQKRLETMPVEMAGDRYVQLAPVETAPQISYERKGSEVHYSRRGAAGREADAFVDKGKQLDVKDWSHKETVLAALRVAASKWESITITGNENYKETVVQLAAEHGFKITNPELQDRIEKARADLEAQRPAIREGLKEKEPAKVTAAPRADAERGLALDQAPERLDQEAKRETREAGQAAASQPNPVAARAADRAADENPRSEIPANRNQTAKAHELRVEQSKVLSQEQQEKERQAQQDRENLEREKLREFQRQIEKPRRHRE